MKNPLWMALVAFGPAEILAFLNKWFDLLQGTGLAHPHWRHAANNLALAIATLLMIVIFIVFLRCRESVMRRAAIAGFIASVVALALCALVKQHTSEMPSRLDIEQWKRYWHVTYVGMAVIWLGTVSILSMYLLKHAQEMRRNPK